MCSAMQRAAPPTRTAASRSAVESRPPLNATATRASAGSDANAAPTASITRRSAGLSEGVVTAKRRNAPRQSYAGSCAGCRFLELAVRHQPVEAALAQVLNAHALELAQRVGQRTTQHRGHALRIAVRTAE